jgi:hypothetical protein
MASTFPGRDNSHVSVESTKLEGMTDFAAIEVSYSMMRYNKALTTPATSEQTALTEESANRTKSDGQMIVTCIGFNLLSYQQTSVVLHTS